MWARKVVQQDLVRYSSQCSRSKEPASTRHMRSSWYAQFEEAMVFIAVEAVFQQLLQRGGTMYSDATPPDRLIARILFVCSLHQPFSYKHVLCKAREISSHCLGQDLNGGSRITSLQDLRCTKWEHVGLSQRQKCFLNSDMILVVHVNALRIIMWYQIHNSSPIDPKIFFVTDMLFNDGPYI